MTVVAIVPIKLNNERLPGKNLLPLPDGSTLLSRILATLTAVDSIDDVYVFCSDPQIEAQVEAQGAHFLRRSPSLDLATATSNDILGAFAEQVTSDVYVLVHATAPFLTIDSLARGVDAIVSGGHDSALSVSRLQTFYWEAGQPANYDPSRIPRTQDLAPLMVETSGFYAFTRDTLITTHRRVGDHPALIELSRIESLDVDDPDDWDLVSAVVAGTES